MCFYDAGLQKKLLQSWSLSSSKWSIKQQQNTPDFCQNQQTNKNDINRPTFVKISPRLPNPSPAFGASGIGLAIFGVDSCGGGLASASSSTISTGMRGGAWDRRQIQSATPQFHRFTSRVVKLIHLHGKWKSNFHQKWKWHLLSFRYIHIHIGTFLPFQF